jgi:uracil DNA glycosylase
MLWGKKAHDKDVMIDQKKHLVLKNVHPSPLAG